VELLRVVASAGGIIFERRAESIGFLYQLSGYRVRNRDGHGMYQIALATAHTIELNVIELVRRGGISVREGGHLTLLVCPAGPSRDHWSSRGGRGFSL